MENAISDLPERPLNKEEVDSLEESGEFVSVAVVYAGMVNPAAFGSDKIPGLVFAGDEWVKAIAFNPDDMEWDVIYEDDVSTDEERKSSVSDGFSALHSKLDMQTLVGAEDNDN